jgi:DNA-binding beta-propeller fold protein YncE
MEIAGLTRPFPELRRAIRMMGMALPVLVAVVIAFCPDEAVGAEAPAPLWKKCETGSGAGQCQNPRGIGIDSNTGHLFIADQGNNRIVELDAWGQFVKAWGWGVADGSAEIQVCTSSCQAGTPGGGRGQFNSPQGIAMDSEGNMYVADNINHRVQKFDPSGEFLLMFGGDVNKTKVEAAAAEVDRNRCPVSPGDICQAGVTGTGSGQFEDWPNGNVIAAGPAGQIYVGDAGRIQVFDANGNFVSQVSSGALAGEKVQSLVADPLGDFYVTFYDSFPFEAKDNVQKLSPAGAPICTMQAPRPNGIAIGPAGNVYVLVGEHRSSTLQPLPTEIRQFSSSCAETGPTFGVGEIGGENIGGFSQISGIAAAGSPCLSSGTDVYVANSIFSNSFIRTYGPPPDNDALCPPPPHAPEIRAQHALSVGTEEATLRAQINPKFWGDTSYYLEWGTEDCAVSACERTALFPGAALGVGVIDEFVNTGAVFLGDLESDTTYYYRFVAESEGGGPVRGNGGTQVAEGSSSHFTTFPAPTPPPIPDPCPNAAFRNGWAARLPDCRAYEMVSPLDKANSDIAVTLSLKGNAPANFEQSEQGGEALAYSSFRSFGDAPSAPWTSHYLARRGEGGWSTKSISPPREGLSFLGNVGDADRQFMGFSEDLCSGWLLHGTEPTLAPDAPAGVPNLYRRNNCGAPSYQPMITTPLADSKALELELQGFSEDASHTVFRAQGGLTPNAALGNKYQVYEAFEGQLRLVSVLPPKGSASTGVASTEVSSAGSDSGNINSGRRESVWQAVSADGTRVYWSAGKLYLRLNADADPGEGECGEEGQPCTIAVSSKGAEFQAASRDATRAIYTETEGGALFEFAYEPETGETHATKLAGGVKGVMGASADATWVYFVSGDDLDAGGPAQAGGANLYVREGKGGGITFIAALSTADADFNQEFSPIAGPPLGPERRLSRITPDGRTAAFVSNASLTGYDNTDAASGKVDSEVFLYDADAKELHCVSCIRSGARPEGRDLFEGANEYWADGLIPAWQSQLYPTRALAEDGNRLFFNSFSPLVLVDTNGKADVYEWEAPGEGDCEVQSSTFVQAAGGCIRLISSGESPADSEFVDADKSGKSVFFKTDSSLLSQDPGLVDIYAARVEGGFPPPPQPPAACEGEACQSPPDAPNDPTPASSAFQGAGNVVQRPAKKQRKKHPRHKKKRHSRQAKHNRGGVQR